MSKNVLDKIGFKRLDEFKQFVLGALLVGTGFTVVLLGFDTPFELLSYEFLFYIIPVTSLTGFSLFVKSFFQKTMARHTEAFMEFKLWLPGGIIGVFTSLLGVVAALAGGVRFYTDYYERYGMWKVDLNPQQLGVLSLVGVSTYLLLAIFFAMLSPIGLTLSGQNVFMFGGLINSYLALFSLLPVQPLDGKHVARDNMFTWGMMVVFSLVAVIFFQVV